jgi:hypothetical protein
MFQKHTTELFHRTLQNVKKGFQNGYHHVKNIAGGINHGVHIAKHVYSAIEPALRELTPGTHHHIHNHAIKALNGYESLRDKALDLNHHASTVGHKLSGLF